MCLCRTHVAGVSRPDHFHVCFASNNELWNIWFVPELFLDAFNWAKKRTRFLGDAQLEMIIIEGRTYCQACGETYRTTEYGKKCPHCGSDETYLLTGDQVIIKDITAVSEEEESE